MVDVAPTAAVDRLMESIQPHFASPRPDEEEEGGAEHEAEADTRAEAKGRDSAALDDVVGRDMRHLGDPDQGYTCAFICLFHILLGRGVKQAE